MDLRPTAARPEPSNKLSKEERQSIINVMNSPDFANMTAVQAVVTLADRGIYIASESTFYRVLKAEDQNAHRGKSKKATNITGPETFVATGPNQVWTWDITWIDTYVKGKYYKLYTIIDIFSRKIVGWEIWEEENGELASELMDRTVIKENMLNKNLVLHSDNGSPMKSFTFKAKLEDLGVKSSYSRPRVSNDNPYSEAHFKTMKYRYNYPIDGFNTIEDARIWVLEFVTWYNQVHYHSGINYLTPESLHTGTAHEIMKKRRAVYESNEKLNPHRFNTGTRKWEVPKVAFLNPSKETKEEKNTPIKQSM